MEKDVKNLLRKWGIVPHREDLYRTAVTHVSYRNEHPECRGDYDQLEFIGDSVLSLVVADHLVQRFPDFRSGKLSKYRSYLVKGKSLAVMAEESDILSYAYLSRGESNNNLDRGKLQEDMFEALIGAVYLDQGYDEVYRLVSRLFSQKISTVNDDDVTDAKSRLQELLQRESAQRIEYRVAKEEGSAQDRYYEIQVVFNDVVLGVGSGGSKKEAEQNAARDALERRVK